MGLTKKQQRVLRFIGDYIEAHGLSPGYADIAAHLGVQTLGPIRKYIKALSEQGYIAYVPHKQRSIRLLGRSDGMVESSGFPLVGKIAAGEPIMAFEAVEQVDLNVYFGSAAQRYLLVVEGDSMVDAGIAAGDWVLVDRGRAVQHRDIVVALVDGERVTLKRYLDDGGVSVVLQPENALMSPMVYERGRVVIQGVVVAQMRRYIA